MKNQILLISLLLFCLSSNAQISILNGPIGDCNKYTLQYDGNLTPPFYPGWGAYPDGSGYSHFWYTSDGQTSCAAQASFSFVNSPIQVNLVLTPRKKPIEDHKERIQVQMTYDRFGNPLQFADPAICAFPAPINLEPWSDLSPKCNDTVYISFPLERCNNPVFSGSLTFSDNELGSPFFLPFGGINITNQTNSSVDFNFIWPNIQQTAEIVVGFEVLAEHNQLVHCSLSSADSSNCKQEMEYVETAKDGPYDPNILEPSLGANMDDCEIAGDSITYNLQFQNEGYGPTERVCVFIKLDDNIEASSFRLVGARASGSSLVANVHNSSSMSNFLTTRAVNTTYNPNDQHVYCVELPNCTLQPKVQDYNASIGYVTFKAKVINNLSPGQQMSTESEVVFNHNLAVQTNEAITSCSKSKVCENTFWCWVKCWHKWIIGILLLLFLWCFWGKLRGSRKK